MRMKVKDHQGNKIYVSACKWPRVSFRRYKSAGISPLETLSCDYREAEQYVSTHPQCSVFDIELECHFGQSQASHIMSKLVKENRVMQSGHGRNRRFHVRMS